MDVVALGQQKLGQIAAVLSGDTRNEGDFGGSSNDSDFGNSNGGGRFVGKHPLRMVIDRLKVKKLIIWPTRNNVIIHNVYCAKL